MSTNTNALQFVNPINLGGNELINSLIEKLAVAPSTPVAGRSYYNTTDNTVYFYNGTGWIDMGVTATNVKVITNDTYSNLADYVTNAYNSSNFSEGDLLVLTIATDPSQRVWINLGTNNNNATDFTAMSNAYDEAEIKAMFGAGDGLNYSNGVFSIGTGEVTEQMLSTAAQTKLNAQGHTWSLATTGVSGVTYSNGVFTITHNMNTRGVAVVMRDSLNDYVRVPSVDKAPTVNTVTIAFAEQPTENQYKVTIYPESLIG